MAPNTRKIILATNIAETSITIPGIRYVIDSGYVKRRIYDPNSGVDSLKIIRISQAQSWQRCGRAGREAEGYCYRIYTQKEMEHFEKMPKPEILRSNISSVVNINEIRIIRNMYFFYTCFFFFSFSNLFLIFFRFYNY